MKEKNRKEDINEWVKKVISGPAGFISYEDHEWPIWTDPREQEIGKFVIRCLANKDCEGSDYVLKEIMARREKMKDMTLVQKAFIAGHSKTSWDQFKKDNEM